jgi:2-amino-4-hydroxy-6-hydroxymethyldihydropteridine diphosphokinase
MNIAYLLTGSNLGNRVENLEKAETLIAALCGKIISASSVYETASWGKTGQPSFLNQALKIETVLNARQLIRKILKLEKQMGRQRREKYDPRIIDVDILLFNHETHRYPFLIIPHPEMQNRRFALTPLSEIAAEVMHPVLNKPVSELLLACTDTLEVKKYS